jgi:hypothetical protein
MPMRRLMLRVRWQSRCISDASDKLIAGIQEVLRYEVTSEDVMKSAVSDVRAGVGCI